MKKALKIIIPVLLSLALIGGTIWYLFSYDRTFTQDALLHTARSLDEGGHVTTAQWFYNMAYKLGKDTDAVAIELAHQYIDDGNYSKAEYTLNNAIKDGAGTSVYMELSRIYTTQGKLQDALNLMNNAPEKIRKELESQRPAAPTANRTQGDLSDYGPISIEAAGKLYVSTTQKMPSVRNDLYKGPLTLVPGENIIYALVVGENGLINEASFRYVVDGVIEPVVFTDKAFEREIRKMLAAEENTAPQITKPDYIPPIFEDTDPLLEQSVQNMLLSIDGYMPNAVMEETEAPSLDGIIYTNQLWGITSFVMPEDATSYADLKYLMSLQELTIRNGVKEQLSCLADCKNLVLLDLSGTSVSTEDLEIIGKMTNLKTLRLGNCGLSTVAALAELTQLEILDLQKNALMDLTPLSKMTALTELYLNHNAITDISVVGNFGNLKRLDVSRNILTTLDPIYRLKSLTHLYAVSQGEDENGGLTSIDGMEALTELTHLALSKNKLTDISPLRKCTALMFLDISYNCITSIEVLQDHNNLLALNFKYNQVEVLPNWDHELSSLSVIDGSDNLLASIESLSGHHRINKIDMDNNEAITEVNGLISCHALSWVSVCGTSVRDVSALEPPEDSNSPETGIKIHYDPVEAEELTEEELENL